MKILLLRFGTIQFLLITTHPRILRQLARSGTTSSQGLYSDVCQVRKRKFEQNQHGTIMVFLSDESLDREIPSRSSITSPFSDTSQAPTYPHDFNQGHSNQRSDVPSSPGGNSMQEESIQRAKVWKLSESPTNSSLSLTSQPNGFTLQETLFVEQLTAIEERVRCQVRCQKFI